MLKRSVGAHRSRLGMLSREGAGYFIAFVFTAACLILVISPLLQSSGPEAGDFAANSLLIQQAKHLTLLVGPFSRALFYHPGPALLYVLAAGESLLYDHLHVVTSPVAGQLVAVAVTEAGWLTVTGWLFARLSDDHMTGLLFTAVYAVFVSSVDHIAIGGLWLPHMYVMPFGCFMLASAAIVLGDEAAFLPFAVAWGYLFNGHISFVAICGIVFIVAAAFHIALSLLGAGRSWGYGFRSLTISASIRGCATVGGVMAAFSVPLLLRILREPSSPIAGYLAFGHANTHHAIPEALGYIAQYWGASPWQWGTALLCLAALAFVAPRSIVAIAVLAAAAGGTLGALFYAVVGVDFYQYSYIELFYSVVPAIVVGSAVALLSQRFFGRYRAVPQAVIGAATLTVLCSWTAIPPYYASQYNWPADIVDAHLQTIAPEPTVIDLPSGNDWALVEAPMLAVEAYRVRHGRPRLCVGMNWHGVFTEDLRCTPDELATERHVSVDVAGVVLPSTAEPLTEAAGLSFFKLNPVCLGPGENIDVIKDRSQFAINVLKRGWDEPETDFVWSFGVEPELSLCLTPAVKKINIHLLAYLPLPNSTQHLTLLINGDEMADYDFNAADPGGWKTISLPEGHPAALQLDLKVQNPLRPSEMTGSVDTRPLGVSLRAISLE